MDGSKEEDLDTRLVVGSELVSGLSEKKDTQDPQNEESSEDMSA